MDQAWLRKDTVSCCPLLPPARPVQHPSFYLWEDLLSWREPTDQNSLNKPWHHMVPGIQRNICLFLAIQGSSLWGHDFLKSISTQCCQMHHFKKPNLNLRGSGAPSRRTAPHHAMWMAPPHVASAAPVQPSSTFPGDQSRVCFILPSP